MEDSEATCGDRKNMLVFFICHFQQCGLNDKTIIFKEAVSIESNSKFNAVEGGDGDESLVLTMKVFKVFFPRDP